VSRGLPSGTVTFLFTDVEGSTKLLHELGDDEYAKALGRHRRVLREAFNAHGGVEVDTQGDAFFVAFATAPDALAAAPPNRAGGAEPMHGAGPRARGAIEADPIAHATRWRSECVRRRLPLAEALPDELRPLLLAPAVKHLEV